ncbi:hypothetical protein EHQ68_11550 [Leptospira congkakensis]|uniref:Uncharacterized protein n=1 Tax=Leptospira congkakensis TaxID=2484932 RepID=A0A4Z1A4Q4_9LEPT|nr:hypothetical protein [Leptospira congkakensis]TGL87185.1 hypothetical protein EHQ68_11550 [Leptospira congkakensis]TGL96753.1 hypothetical protein EHQ69_00495 [Leptospira congkakensis]TGL97602.1 hypothetical protein EHQ70_06150 [Leptospira congkakensis]
MFKFKFVSVFLLFGLFYQCKSLETKAPFFNSPSQENLTSDFKINLVELGFYRKVNNDWWGEDFYVVTLEVTNLTKNFRFFNICDDKLTERNLEWTIKNSDYARYYVTSPARFEKDDVLVGFPEMKLFVEIPNQNLVPTATYGGKPLFPKVNGNVYAAAMTACQYGIPMSRDTDAGRTTTGWLAQNGGKGTIRAIYSVPAGAKLLKLEQTKVFSADLQRFEKQK